VTAVAEYVDLAGVRTWYDVVGEGEPVLLVHPGGVGVDSRVFDSNLPGLAASYRVYTPDRRGHGRTPDVDGPITYELMANDTIAFLDQAVGEPARVVGVSDGAIVSLLAAMRRPDLVERLAFVAGVFHRDAWHPSALESDPQNPSVPDILAEAYGSVSPDGPEHAAVVARKLAHMHATEPTLGVDDLARVPMRTLVMVGDDDEVPLDHANAMYSALPIAELCVVPGTSHGLLVEKAELCNAILLDFLSNEPVATFAPIRRA
jgi:pimeloyl-ACP methyl ester carboxylesterase